MKERIIRVWKKDKFFYLSFLAILVLGVLLRFIGIKWGWPYRLHPDEWTVVESAIDMIKRKSFQPNVFFRPDHFEIQLSAIVFSIVSFFKFGTVAENVFRENLILFYVISRGITCFFGSAMIVFGYLIGNKFNRKIGLISAFLIAFFPIFIQHSHYATPDIYQASIIMALIYVSICFIEKDSNMLFFLMCLLISISIAIKYTGAILCFLIAGILIIQVMEDKNYKKFFKRAFLSVFFIILFLFFISPVLFINFQAVVKAFISEARSYHLGADRLGFLGNLVYYIKEYMYSVGILLVAVTVAGGGLLFTRKEKRFFPLFIGPFYWIILSRLSLHWQRWGIPVFGCFLIFLAVGLFDLYQIAKKRNSTKYLMFFIVFISFFGMIMNAIVTTTRFVIPDTRVVSERYCEENGITKANTLFEAYTTFSKASSSTIMSQDKVVKEDGERLLIQSAKADYLIVSSNMYLRFYAEPERYKKECSRYDKIEEQYEQIQFYKTYQPEHTKRRQIQFGIQNILDAFQELNYLKKVGYTGPDLKIYKVAENQHLKYTLGEVTYFDKEKANFENWVIDGLYSPEEKGIWTTKEAKFRFYLKKPEKDLELRFQADSYFPHWFQEVEIYLNGTNLGFASREDNQYTITLPSELIQEKNDFIFKVPNASIPIDSWTFSNEKRELGIFLKELFLIEKTE